MSEEILKVKCKHCEYVNVFEQPYPYHAGFSNLGFLYNESGNLTFIWSTFDPFFTENFPGKHPWTLNNEEKRKFEELLIPSPHGDKWLFKNSAKCTKCSETLGESIEDNIYFLVYPESVDCSEFEKNSLRTYTILG